MLEVHDFTIYSAVEDEHFFEIEGEVVFDNDHSTEFSVTISTEKNTIEQIEFEFQPDEYDEEDFRIKALKYAREFDE